MSDETEAAPRGRKSPGAYRTISEVADDLQVPQHVLRFWETKFPQIRPLKRGGGRRYYRPEDILLLRRISDLLYVQGYTIKGVQRLLRDGGADAAAEADAGDEELIAVEGEPAAAPRPQLALPGMADPEPLQAAAKPVVRVRAESSATPRPVEPGASPDLAAAEREIGLLRSLLAEAANELVAVRALLARATGKAP
jgi:DNA-binding transcriptional MerR regulator